MEALYLFAIAQTVLFNPTLTSVGTLRVYLCGVTWLVVGAAAVVRWTMTSDVVLLGANRRLAVVCWVSITAVGVHLLLVGPQVYTAGSFIRLLYAPLGVFCALAVYERIDRILDITVGLVGLECVILVLSRLGSPVDLSNRLNPASLGGRNAFGAFLMVLIVLRVSLWAYTRRRPPWYVLAGLGSSLVALVLTLARSPVLGLVVGLGAISVSALRRRGVTGRSLRAGAVIAAVLSPVLSQPAARKRLTSLSLDNSSGRNDIWGTALDLFRRSPIVGHGFGSFNVTSPNIIEDFVSSAKYGPVTPGVAQPTSSAHNVLLQVMAEGGLIGLAIVSWSVYYLLRACWHAVLVPVTLAILVDSMFDTFPYVVQMSWVLGLVFATGLQRRSSEEAVEASPLG